MADQFDIIDIVYKAVEPASMGITVYKLRSRDAEVNNHIVIASLPLQEKDVVNKDIININIFVRRLKNGMSDNDTLKPVVRSIKSALRSIETPLYMYWSSRIVWSESLGEAKEGFDCMNIRLEIITEKD